MLIYLELLKKYLRSTCLDNCFLTICPKVMPIFGVVFLHLRDSGMIQHERPALLRGKREGVDVRREKFGERTWEEWKEQGKTVITLGKNND